MVLVMDVTTNTHVAYANKSSVFDYSILTSQARSALEQKKSYKIDTYIQSKKEMQEIQTHLAPNHTTLALK